MIAIHPWFRGIPVGFVAFWIALPSGFGKAVFVAGAAWTVVSLYFTKQQQAFEQKLLHRKRLYTINTEQTFALIQRALANAWLDESHWQSRITDMADGYMLYKYEWREPESQFDDGRTRRHANLQIEVEDRTDADGIKTLVTYAFDGLPNGIIKTTYYDAIHVAMGAIDAFLPDYTIITPESQSSAHANSAYVDTEMAGG